MTGEGSLREKRQRRKVTNYGEALLTDTLRTARTIQNHFLGLDFITDESQCACPSGDTPVPRWTTTSPVAYTDGASGSFHATKKLNNQRPEQLQCLRYTSSFALWPQVRSTFCSHLSRGAVWMERMDRAPCWRAASSHPARWCTGASDLLQCHTPLW